MSFRAIFVLTRNDRLGDGGDATGYHLAELIHPLRLLTDAGVHVNLASPGGGGPPMNPGSRNTDDPENRWFLERPEWRQRMANTHKPEIVDANEFDAIYFPGGHGTSAAFNAATAPVRLSRKERLLAMRRHALH